MKLQTLKAHGLPSEALPETYRTEVDLFNRWLDGRPVKAETIKAYFAELEKGFPPLTNGLRPSTLGKKKSALKKAIAQARGASLTFSEKAQLTEVFREIKTGQADVAVHEHEILTRAELSAITKSAGPKTSALISALYETAARVSELLDLRLDDCKARGENVFCEIRRGKGKKQRIAFMSKATFDKLKQLYNGKTYLVERNGKQISRHGVKKLVMRAGEIVGRTDIHPHTLRHCAATHLLAGGKALAAVSAYCGHSNPSVTARFYLHSKPTAGEVIKILGAL